MITGDNDDGIVKLANFFQRADGPGNHFVEVFNFNIIIKDIIPNDCIIRKDFRNNHFRRILTGTLSGSQFISPVRLTGSQPEAEGLTLFYLF